MLFYSDERTRSLEREEKMIDCVEYLFDKWNGDRNNVPLMLKLAITIWYTFDMDGKELSLTREEQYYLGNMMNNVYCYFMRHRARDENCQWVFSYIMTVRTENFLYCISDLLLIEKIGACLNELSAEAGNVFAQYFEALENFGRKSKEMIKYQKRAIEQIPNTFDESQEIDRYFIRILNSKFL